MLRQITYRTAINAFIFTGLWLAIGGIVMWSPIPEALGISGPMFAAWLLLLFAMLALAGGALTMAALNTAFPPRDRNQPPQSPNARRAPPVPVDRSKAPIWAPPARPDGGNHGRQPAAHQPASAQRNRGS